MQIPAPGEEESLAMIESWGAALWRETLRSAGQQAEHEPAVSWQQSGTKAS